MKKELTHSFIVAFLLVSLFAQGQHVSSFNEKISLAGIWKFKIDPFETGISANGVQLLPSLVETVTLPGSTDQNAKGYKTQSTSSLRLARTFEYKGVAWYEKELTIPTTWQNKEVELFLERAHWQTEVWVNGHPVGKRESLSTPHRYFISSLLQPGKKNKILIKVNNDMIYNIEHSHAISEETQTNWNGIIGEIALHAFDKVKIENVQAYPNANQKEVKLVIRLLNHTQKMIHGTLNFKGATFNVKNINSIPSSSITFSGSDSLIIVNTTVSLGHDVKTWDEFSPSMYRLQIDMKAASDHNQYTNSSVVEFGVRTFKTNATRFEINGKPTFIRGTVNCAEFPITGYPPTSKTAWLHIFKTCKDYGLNAMRFHSWCPPKAAFEAADELGFYLQVENSDWRFTIGKDSAVNAFLIREAEDILKTYGNHPSFLMLCEGNELVGPTVKEFLTNQVTHWHKIDPRRLYTGSAAYPLIDKNDYHVLYGPRAHRWKEGLNSRFNKQPLDTKYDYSDYVQKYSIPIITHEVGQWCSYPNFDEIEEYTGVLKPYNYELFRELLRDQNMLDQAKDFTMASGKFKVVQNKEEIESYLRTPGLGGYHFLQLQDFPGQGTAPVGMLDVFWNPKPFTNAAEFRQFQNTRVPLLRTSSFTWVSDQNFTATAQFTNFDSAALKGVRAQWSFCFPDGTIYASGSFDKIDIPIGGPFTLGEISISLQEIHAAVQMKLTISLPGTSYSNHWSIWVYPSRLPPVKTENVMIADSWNPNVVTFLEKGGSVLLLADTAKIASSVVAGFSGISWNTVWSGMPPNLLGILCKPDHPALRHFPTEYHSNWQWWDLVTHSKPMILNHFPFGFKPLIQLIPDWNNPQKLSMLFEAKVGKGKILVAAIDLRNNMTQRPVARQLLYSLKKYISSNEFQPNIEISMLDVERLFQQKNGH